jgi:hypothetical protein
MSEAEVQLIDYEGSEYKEQENFDYDTESDRDDIDEL